MKIKGAFEFYLAFDKDKDFSDCFWGSVKKMGWSKYVNYYIGNKMIMLCRKDMGKTFKLEEGEQIQVKIPMSVLKKYVKVVEKH